MTFELHWLNFIWLVLPLPVWNLILGARITNTRVTSDAHSPQWLLIAENFVRIPVFALPLLIPLPLGTGWKSAPAQAGLVVYIFGMLVYFTSWLPLLFAPASAWSNCPVGLLAPRLTPYLSFLGIALLGDSWLYGAIAAVFIFLHTWHGIQNL